MTEFAEKYINPFTDYGFKKIFGEEPNKDLLLDFLNVLLKEEQGETSTNLFFIKFITKDEKEVGVRGRSPVPEEQSDSLYFTKANRTFSKEIKDLTYLKSEQLGAGEVDRKAIFDLYISRNAQV